MISKYRIDLNLDAGEMPEALADGSEEALYQIVSSVNIACGGHAGDESSMKRAVELALKYNLNIGAHPSFPDRQNFGREILQMSHDHLVESLAEQTEALRRIVRDFGAKLSHIKPHGSLYNLAARDLNTADAIIEAVRNLGEETLPIMALAGSPFINWIKQAGLGALEEAFADRRYEADGALRGRKYPDALIKDPHVAAAQALQIVSEGKVTAITGEIVKIHADSICVHGDSPHALPMAKAVRAVFEYK
ncbi:MAG: 5-oxoprolinase subunit PxpA [Pseudobdellovibrio sp.]